jgi:hypothetical protein
VRSIGTNVRCCQWLRERVKPCIRHVCAASLVRAIWGYFMLHTPWTALENTLLRVSVCHAIGYLLFYIAFVRRSEQGPGGKFPVRDHFSPFASCKYADAACFLLPIELDPAYCICLHILAYLLRVLDHNNFVWAQEPDVNIA